MQCVLYIPAESIEHGDVGKHVEDVVGVGRVIKRGPLLRGGRGGGEEGGLWFALIVHAIKTYHLYVWPETKEDVGMSCHEKEREQEYTYADTGTESHQ